MNWYCNGQLTTRRAVVNGNGPLVVYGGSFYTNFGGVYKIEFGSDDVLEAPNRSWHMTVGFVAQGEIVANDDGSSGAFASVSWYSDKRIKKDIQSINDATALEKLRLLNPCTYEYINKVKMGYATVQGFIAQEVKEVLPYAVKTDFRQIPNIYKWALIHSMTWVTKSLLYLIMILRIYHWMLPVMFILTYWFLMKTTNALDPL